MTIRNAQLVAPVILTNAAVTLYTVPANTQAIITEASIANTSGGATVKLTINIVPNAGSPSASNTITPGVGLAPNSIYPCAELIGKTLPAGTMISAHDDTGGVCSMEVSGYLTT